MMPDIFRGVLSGLSGGVGGLLGGAAAGSIAGSAQALGIDIDRRGDARARVALQVDAMATQCFAGSCISYTNFHPTQYNFQAPTAKTNFRKSRRRLNKVARKPLKSESKAQELLRDLIGWDQWKVYRKTNRVILLQGGLYWMIGDIFGNYNKATPFSWKPDVVRIDNPDKLYATDLCVAQGSGETTPYTDKVITFATHLMADEKEFMRHANRIGEMTFNKMKECAVWEIQ